MGLNILWCFPSLLFFVAATSYSRGNWIKDLTFSSDRHTDLLLDHRPPAPVSSPDESVQCGPNQFKCADGAKCIPAHWRCDNRADCDDDSDEPKDCELQSNCQQGQFKCTISQRCIPTAWKCDGEPDCGSSDRSDEDPHTCNKAFKCPPNKSRCENQYEDGESSRFMCIPTEQFCDGRTQCPDTSDEWDQCSPKNALACKSFNCSHGCKPTREGAACYCPPGQEPQGSTCVDSNECLLPFTCEQKCTNLNGSYECLCVDGYKKEDNLCKAVNEPENEEPSLILTTQRDLRRVKLTGELLEGNKTLAALGVHAVDFDYANRKICYIHNNVTRHSLVCVSADDFSIRQILPIPTLFPDLSYVSHISYEWISHNWYFVDNHREVIYACDKNLKLCRIIVEMDLNKVKGYVLDPTRGYQFWSVWGLTPVSISRSNLDGEDRKQLVTQKLVYPEGLTIYLPTGRLYWVESYLDYVESVDFEGNNRMTVKKGYKTQTFTRLAVFESRLYLPVSHTTGLVALSRLHSRETTSLDLKLRDNLRVVYFDVFHKQKQPDVRHPCQVNNGGCQHLCITGFRNKQSLAICVCTHGYRLLGRGECVRVDMPSFLIYSKGTPPMIKSAPITKQNRTKSWEPMVPITDVGMPTALDYDPNTNYIYYSDVQRFVIVRQKIDGTGREQFVTMNIDNCEGLAVDWLGRNLYWTDEALGQISVARLDYGKMRKVLIEATNFNPRCIVLDPSKGMMYWSDWASHSHDAGKIEMAYMDGQNRTTLVSDGLYWPNGLAIDYDNRKLYWCDTYLNQIESINLDGTNRKEVLSRTLVHKPYGVAILGSTLFWTEHRSGLVRRWMNNTIDVLATEPQQLYDLKLFDSKAGSNACSLNLTLCPELCLARPDPPGYICASANDEAAIKGHQCPPDYFDCGHGNCIKQKYVCDGDADCPNKADEDKTAGGPCANMVCPENQFSCDTNRCIDLAWVCDAHEDCRDGSDESSETCKKGSCSADQFACKISGRCLPAGWRCDKQFDCGTGDLSDEDCDAPDCDESMFRCDNGNCLPWLQFCDGNDDCRDGSDEKGCRLACDNRDEFLCPAEAVCIPMRSHCDGRMDCADGADEKGCGQNSTNNGLETFSENLCEEHEFQCSTLGECIRKEFHCDMREDCVDGSDERNCEYVTNNVTTTSPASTTPTTQKTLTCDKYSRLCDNATRCVPFVRLCDGNFDCWDGSDEGLRCGESNMCDGAGCTDLCHSAPEGPLCFCSDELTLMPDNVTCSEEQICSAWGICSQTCKRGKTVHKCTCVDGYKLAEDGFTCKTTDNATPMLLYSDRHEIHSVDLATSQSRTLVTSLKFNVALSFYKDGDVYQIYWNDIIQEKIFRGNLIGGYVSNTEVVIESGLETAEGMAVDWIGQNLYWLESHLHQIEVCKLNGSHRSTLIAGDMGSPRALAIDSRDGLLFWTDWGEKAPRIESCSLAGLHRTVVAKGNIGDWPNGLSLDLPVRRIYWADARSHTIFTSKYDGTDLQVVLSSSKLLSHPYALAMHENNIYWTDWRKDSIVKADRFGVNPAPPVVLHRATGKPVDLMILHPSKQPPGPPNPCQVNNGNCSHLCLVDGPGKRVCACPNIMTITEDGVSCQEQDEVLAIVSSGSWICVWLKAALVLPFGPTPAPTSAPAFHAAKRFIYWPNSNYIIRKNLTSGPYERLIDAGIERPSAVAVDWQAQLLFFASNGKTSGLYVSNLDAEYTTKIIDDVNHVVSLQADAKSGKLYFIWEPVNSIFHKSIVTSGKMPPYLIERINMDGSGRVSLLASGTRIISLSLHESSSLYYVDVKVGKIKRLDLKTSKVTEVLAKFIDRPTSVVAYKEHLYYGDELGVYRCDIRNCNNSTKFRNTTEPTIALTLYSSELQPKFESACDKRKVKCQHLCLPNSDVDSTCKCALGYEAIDKDGIICRAIDDILIYSADDAINGLRLKGNQKKTALGPISKVNNPGALAYHADSDSIFWSDKHSGAITRIERDGSFRKEIVPASDTNFALRRNPGLALDWMAGNIYWTDPIRFVVEVARLDGSSRYVIIANEEDLPEDLFVDPSSRFLFYTSGLRVKRAWLDGSNSTILFTGIEPINDLAVDIERRRVYWSTEGRIMSSTYAGTNIRVHLDKENATIATLDVFDGVVYWGEIFANEASIYSAPIANMSDSKTLLEQFSNTIDDLQVYSSVRQRGTNDCSSAKDKCHELCLMTGSGARCVCTHGVATSTGCQPYNVFLMYSRVTKIESIHIFEEKSINAPYAPIEDKEIMHNAIALTNDFDRSMVFYSDLQRGSINTVLFNGSGHSVLIEQQGAVEGLHYDTISDSLFWTCNSEPSVRKAAMSGLDRQTRRADTKVIVRLKRNDKPRGIDVDSCEARVYWTNWNKQNPSIDRAYTNGYGSHAIITTQILMPNSLTLDRKAKKLYWTDARLDKIERCEYDGSLRVIVTQKMSSHPFDIAVFGENIFWTDWIEQAVVRANKHTGLEVVKLKTNAPRPMGIIAVAPVNHSCGMDPCSIQNGGCSGDCRVDSYGEARCHCTPPYVLRSDGRTCGLEVSSCETGQFSCAEGPCIPMELTCDGVPHCSESANASDEDALFCTTRVCPSNLFACRSGSRCIPLSLVCDGMTHCPDGTDELHCSCPADNFRCDDGTCIPQTQACDGKVDCAHYEDERNCQREDCRAKQLANCKTTPDCYNPKNKCDGNMDCIDGSDEDNCTATNLNRVSICGEGTFACTGGGCILNEWRCDGRNDCLDGEPASDELSCIAPTLCQPNQVRCGNESHGSIIECIPSILLCDGVTDCTNGWDESEHCDFNKTLCQPFEFTCLGTDKCIPLEQICDGQTHCPDGSDEIACTCADPTAFRCAMTRDCLDKSQYCDGRKDCPDGSDEPPNCWPAPDPVSNTTDRVPSKENRPECAVTCDNNACVPRELVCDGRDHCLDGRLPSPDEDPILCASLRAGCNAGEWSCQNGACVSTAQLCDGIDQCGDYSDERYCNVDECVNDVCAHNCTDMTVGYACWCLPGYRAKGKLCVDVDECVEDQPCDHNCRNTHGSFVCSCQEGYSLSADKATCIPISPIQASLLFTNRYYIRRVGLTADAPTTTLVHNLTNAVALDFDWKSKCLYWSDVTSQGSSIKRYCGMQNQLSDQTYQVLHSSTLQNPDGLAVDWVAGNLYWCDKGTDTVEVSRLDGRYRRVLLRGGLHDPRAVALNPSEGTMYWSDWGENPHIGRAGMDGSNREIIISERLGWPNALTISYDTRELFFGDAKEDYIAVANLDGTNIRKLFSRADQANLRLQHVFAIAVWSGYVYWSDWETKSIEACWRHRMPGNTTYPDKMADCMTISPTVHKPMDMRIYHPYRQKAMPDLTDACLALNCSGLCLLTPDPLKRVVCACPEHFYLAEDNRSCIANCSSAHYHCRNTLKCIPYWWRCDTQDDCGDGSDEEPSCPGFHCSPGEFQCDGSRCLHPSNICNGHTDCQDKSDEKDCDLFSCLSNQFKCPANESAKISARCIPSSQRCNGKQDCDGGEDEKDCPPVTCSANEFKCANNHCIPMIWVCDDDDDCGDKSEEKVICSQRTCSFSEFRCTSGRCIPKMWLCDQENDCQHGEDEVDCDGKPPPTCEPTYFRCNGSQKCIPGRWRCDHQNDCDDGSDEESCVHRDCEESEFRCNDGQCVWGGSRCDGTRQCADGSDEIDCGKTCATGHFSCHDTSACILQEWVCDGDADCMDGSDEASCDHPHDSTCRAPMQPCGPGACVLPAHACDGRADCPQGADEDEHICKHYACPPSLYRCHSTNRCIPSHLRCDNIDDCGDNSDENPQYCKAIGLCLGNSFKCENGPCINGTLKCNGINDCGDGSDEANCNRTQCEVHFCSQICVPRHSKNYTYSCKCGVGFRIQGTGEAAICEAYGEKAELLLSTDNGLRSASFYKPEQLHYDIFYRNDTTDKIDGLAILWSEDKPTVYWVEDDSQEIRRADLVKKNGDETKMVLGEMETLANNAGSVRSIAIDYVSGCLYWTVLAPIPSVKVGSLAMKMQRTLVANKLYSPEDIVLHVHTRHMVWSDWGTSPSIEIAGMDGSDRKTLVKKRVWRPSGLAIDHYAGRLYWTDPRLGVIELINLDGSGRRLLVDVEKQGAAGTFSTPLRLDVFEEFLIGVWRRGVVRINKRSGVISSLVSGGHRINDVAVLHLATQDPTLTNPCTIDPCHPSAFCVLSPSTANKSCLCPDGLVQTSGKTEIEITCRMLRTGIPSCPRGCGPGTCNSGVCICPPTHTGAHCQHDKCADRCRHRGTCRIVDQEPQCFCSLGWTGERCEIAVLGCSDVICHNGGTCETGGKCICAPGYKGDRCEICVGGDGFGGDVSCGPDGVCSRGVSGATCTCGPGRIRPLCECAVPCYNDGDCLLSTNGTVSCKCRSGWKGDTCDVKDCGDKDCPVDKKAMTKTCDDVKCLNGGECHMTTVGPLCKCSPQYAEELCTRYVGWGTACSTLKCAPNSFCVSVRNAPEFCAIKLTKDSSSHKVWTTGAAVITILLLLMMIGSAVFVVIKRRSRAFSHARLTENVEINNPMYLQGGDDDLDQLDRSDDNIAVEGDGRHFANPVYESMYNGNGVALQPSPPLQKSSHQNEERANLLAEACEDVSGTPPLPNAERSLLL